MIRKTVALLAVLASNPLLAEELAPIPQAERTALERLFESTGGPDWCDHSGWLGPRGSECDWYGVRCGFRQGGGEVTWGVWSLDLWNNNLVGTLPGELDQLTELEYLHLSGNSVMGSVPPGILRKWLGGQLIFQGYAEIAGVWQIQIQLRTVIFCTDFEATLTSDGTAQLRSERCSGEPRPKYEGSEGLNVHCQTQVGQTDRFGDAFSHLAWLLEQQGFDRLERQYSRSITHGGELTVSVWGKAGRRTVLDYADSAPMNLWTVQQAVQGVVRDVIWERSEESPECPWTNFVGVP